MPALANDVIVFVLKSSHIRFHSFIDDLKPEEFAVQPIPGVNSVAWMLGHLTVVERRILGLFGGELPPLPEGFDVPFKTTKAPATTQTGLGDPKELVAAFDAHRLKLIEAVATASEEQLASPLPMPIGVAKTLGDAAAFMAVHVGLHAGQISVIRRSLGYPPVV